MFNNRNFQVHIIKTSNYLIIKFKLFNHKNFQFLIINIFDYLIRISMV